MALMITLLEQWGKSGPSMLLSTSSPILVEAPCKIGCFHKQLICCILPATGIHTMGL